MSPGCSDRGVVIPFGTTGKLAASSSIPFTAAAKAAGTSSARWHGIAVTTSGSGCPGASLRAAVPIATCSGGKPRAPKAGMKAASKKRTKPFLEAVRSNERGMRISSAGLC